MWTHRYLSRIDFRIFPIVFVLMILSILVISSMTLTSVEYAQETLISQFAWTQLRWYCIGWGVFFIFAGFDYHKFREWTWILYLLFIFLLLGLYFANPIQNVHRWYRLPFIGIHLQPSEFSKLIVVLSLSWFLEKKRSTIHQLPTALQVFTILFIPFVLILKQPDLGTALILLPIALIMCYFAGIHPWIQRFIFSFGCFVLSIVFMIFLGILPHEDMKPIFTKVLKDYQYERLSPNSYHQVASQNAIALGGISGSGWHKSEFSSQSWLPAAHTDSVYPAFAEEFGFIGALFLIGIFLVLIFLSFSVSVQAKDHYGKLLAVGISSYLSMHVIMNIGMMCGFFPISGVPLIFISYGGNSILTTMASLGMLQSIYSRRFMF